MYLLKYNLCKIYHLFETMKLWASIKKLTLLNIYIKGIFYDGTFFIYTKHFDKSFKLLTRKI